MPQFFVHPDIAQAQTLDTAFYTQQIHYDAAKELLFASSWQFVGDAGCVDEPGSCYPFILLSDLLDEPLLLTKDNAGTIRSMSNVCTHRGNLLVQESCKKHTIRCKYHGRQFGLDGSFVSMPEFKEVASFPSVSDDLTGLPLFRWGNLLFTSASPYLKPDEVFGEMMQRMAWFPMNKLALREDLSETYNVAANWALYCENYLEGFHIPFVHEGLNQALDFGAYTTELFAYSNLQLGIGKEGEACFDLPPTCKEYGQNVAAYYFWVFPNMMFNFYPWGLSINIVLPTGLSSCTVKFLTYVMDDQLLNKGAGSGLNEVELEDEAVVQAVQKGIRSRFYTHGRYSVTRETGTHHFHRLIATFMNNER